MWLAHLLIPFHLLNNFIPIPLSLKALGCILYALCYLLHPFQDMGSLGILSAKIKFPEAPVAPEVQTLLMRMLDVSKYNY